MIPANRSRRLRIETFYFRHEVKLFVKVIQLKFNFIKIGGNKLTHVLHSTTVGRIGSDSSLEVLRRQPCRRKHPCSL